jgi:hypothetical protein
MKDYSLINNFSPYLQKKLFEENLAFIKYSLENNKCIIITHHAPSYKCIEEKFKHDKFNCCFASNLEYLFENPNLVGWIYGHLHNNYITYNKKIFLYANCYRTDTYSNSKSIL